MSEEKNKKWIELKKPLGDCSCCIHDMECEPLKKSIVNPYISSGEYQFRCPILVEVDEDVEYG